MFNVVRLVLGCGFFICSVAVIRKFKAIRKRILYVVAAIISVLLTVVLMFFPVENLFVTFDSPQNAYEYYILRESNIKLVIEGKHCDFIVDCRGDVEQYLIIPKNANGWQVGIGSDTKRIVQKQSDGIVICVYQYKNTSDYFITVLDTNGGESIVTDNHNSRFCFLERNNEVLGKKFYTYYAHLSNFDSQYSITVNDNEIMLNP